MRRLLLEGIVALGGGLTGETLRGLGLSEVAQTLNQVVLLELTGHLEVIDAIQVSNIQILTFGTT